MFQRLFQNRLSSLMIIPRLSINTSPLKEECWQCKQIIDRNESPAYCPCEKHVLLPVRPEIDYFRLLDLTRSFEIDTKQLTRLFRNQMKYLHPDLFSNKSETEKKYSQDQSSLLNQAYKTLLSPLARAHYLLKLENITIQESAVELESDFLMHIMELNEKLHDDSDNQPFPIEIAIEIRQDIDTQMKELSNALSTMNLNKAKEILARLQYLNNINEKLTNLELKHGII